MISEEIDVLEFHLLPLISFLCNFKTLSKSLFEFLLSDDVLSCDGFCFDVKDVPLKQAHEHVVGFTLFFHVSM